ncbi:MAG: hypothetical protein JRH14_22980, partial [Deltaproteobacteria bacterium]|nr:hypothetical protein [Deltaproteobacteria bacterium]
MVIVEVHPQHERLDTLVKRAFHRGDAIVAVYVLAVLVAAVGKTIRCEQVYRWPLGRRRRNERIGHRLDGLGRRRVAARIVGAEASRDGIGIVEALRDRNDVRARAHLSVRHRGRVFARLPVQRQPEARDRVQPTDETIRSNQRVFDRIPSPLIEVRVGGAGAGTTIADKGAVATEVAPHAAAPVNDDHDVRDDTVRRDLELTADGAVAHTHAT